MRITVSPIGRAVALAAVLDCFAGYGLSAQGTSAPLPDPTGFSRKVREAVRLDYELQKNYTYVEKRRDVKLSRLGKVTVGPLRTFEVYPSNMPGKTYKRLIAIDGVPLAPAELAQRDAEHRERMTAEAERNKNETPGQRAQRQYQEGKDRREREALMNDAFNVFEAKLVGRENVDGQQLVVATLTPLDNAKTTTREGKWMKKFHGRIWVSEADYQVARIEMEALEDLTIGWGVVGRIHEGTRLVFARRKVDGETWLPAEMRLEASGRTLLFRKFKIDMVTEYSDYRRWSVGTSITYTTPKDERQPDL
jgi:hypothetical protein